MPSALILVECKMSQGVWEKKRRERKGERGRDNLRGESHLESPGEVSSETFASTNLPSNNRPDHCHSAGSSCLLSPWQLFFLVRSLISTLPVFEIKSPDALSHLYTWITNSGPLRTFLNEFLIFVHGFLQNHWSQYFWDSNSSHLVF